MDALARSSGRSRRQRQSFCGLSGRVLPARQRSPAPGSHSHPTGRASSFHQRPRCACRDRREQLVYCSQAGATLCGHRPGSVRAPTPSLEYRKPTNRVGWHRPVVEGHAASGLRLRRIRDCAGAHERSEESAARRSLCPLRRRVALHRDLRVHPVGRRRSPARCCAQPASPRRRGAIRGRSGWRSFGCHRRTDLLLRISQRENSALPRVPFALAERGDFPKAFAAIHRRFHTPYISILVFATLVWAFALIGEFKWNVTLSAVARLLYYGVGCAALPILRRREPEGANAMFRLPVGNFLAVLGVILCVVLVTRVDFGQSLILVATIVLALLNWATVRHAPRTVRPSAVD